MYYVKDLFIPNTLEEALCTLSSNNTIIPIAGGTDILVKMRNKYMKDVSLLSLSHIPELFGISLQSDGTILIGAMSTFSEIAVNRIIIDRIPMLKTAALSMGGPQIQNVSTIGGNVCNGAVSADSAPALFALDAVLNLKSKTTTRSLPIRDFYIGPGKVARQPDELLISISIPPIPNKNWYCAYLKFSTRAAMDIATLGCAITCELTNEGNILRSSIALGVAGPTPVRCTVAEKYLEGKPPFQKAIVEASNLALQAATPRSSWRASKEYREALIKELVIEAFETALSELLIRGE